MLIFSNRLGKPHNFNVYLENDKWLVETVDSTLVFTEVGKLLDYLNQEQRLGSCVFNAVMKRVEDSAVWTKLGTSEDTLSRVLAGCSIESAEPISYPITDGLSLYIVDRDGKRRILEISVTEGLIDDPDDFDDIPLSIRISSPLLNYTPKTVKPEYRENW